MLTSKSDQQKLTELEPFRSELAGKIILIPGYQFTFFRTHPYSSGGLVVLDVDANKKTSTNYAIKVKDGKCIVSFNLQCKPFNIPDYPRFEFDRLKESLEELLAG